MWHFDLFVPDLILARRFVKLFFDEVICTILVMPFLDSQIFLKYFSTAFLLLFSAPLAVCLLGKIHWVSWQKHAAYEI